MNGWALGWLEMIPVVAAAVIVFRHVRDVRRAAAAEEQAAPGPRA